MENVCKEKLEELIVLLNDPDETVMLKEVNEKLEKIVALMNNPEKIEIEKNESKEKLKKVVELVDNAMANPDVELEYCIPEVLTTSETCDVSGDPYIQLKYAANGTHIMVQKLPLKHHYLNKTAQDIANLVTFYIEQFIEQIDSVENGAQ
ncbi:hypothetical protein [Sulfurovum sp.]|uniref:hypothetical protein n=1 Tax=Sulfurovum sp. TaxID=1969726 RepID=UPI003566C140